MLLILVNWLIIAYISFNIGLGVRRLFTTSSNVADLAITTIWGLFIVAMISTVCLFFAPAGIYLLAGFMIVAIAIHVSLREEIAKSVRAIRLFKAKKMEVAFAGLVLFAFLVFSAQSSKINDDGYYYTQTVMWFQEAGFVRGISNLLLPLGLGSSWHVLQAVFAFSFIEGVRLNDLNGLLTLLFVIYCLENGFQKKGNLLPGVLLAITLPISVPFLSASSPDLPVIILTIITFHLLMTRSVDKVLPDVLVLSTFAFSVKLSAVALILLAPVLIVYSVIRSVPVSRKLYGLLFVCFILVLAKNIYQTGYPLFPYPWFGVADLIWATPPELLEHYTAGIKYWGLEEKLYLRSLSEWKDPEMVASIKMLWNTTGYKGIINTFILASFPLILLTVLVDTYRSLRAKSTTGPGIVLHFIFLFNFFVWLIFAPQYRFILPVYIFYVAWLIMWWQSGEKVSAAALRLFPYMSCILVFMLSVVPLSLEVQSTSSHIGRIDALSLETAITPYSSYAFSGVDTLTVGQDKYFHVKGNVYCWDTPLPCMSAAYYSFLNETGFRLIQGRDGRYSRKFLLVPD